MIALLQNLRSHISNIMTSSKIKTTPSTTKTNTEEGKAVQTLPAPPVGFLAAYHPLFIEGPGKNHDKRDPEIAATKILSALKKLWAGTKMTKPVILITQGDPLAPTGISIISQKIAEGLGIQRLLVCLDEDMDPVHIERADRDGVVYEWKYSDLTRILNDKSPGTLKRIEDGIDEEIELKNERRGETLDSWYRDFALLQEITKAVMKAEVGELTMAHTVPNSEIKDNSVTSFYKVGLDLHIVEKEELVEYEEK